MIIAFMGNDGSGKTTISNEVAFFFRELGFDTSYKHEYQYVLLSLLFKAMGKRNLEKSRNEMLVQQKKSLRFRLWPYFVFFDLFFQFILYKISKRHSVMLLDRYPYDHYISFKRLGNLTRLAEWLYLHFPRPDAFVVLTVDPKIAYERKKDTHSYGLEFYVEQTRSYLDLAKKLDLPVIDTSGNLLDNISNTLTKILYNENIRKTVIARGAQNRILYHVLEKYGLSANKDFSRLWTNQSTRKEMLKRSMSCLHSILRTSNTQEYAIIKSIDAYTFIGNDIDVIVSSSQFSKIRNNSSDLAEGWKIASPKRRLNNEGGKMDVFVDHGLKLDIHSFIGWDNIRYLDFDHVKNHIETASVYGITSSVASDACNACLVALHLYERGYMTLDEFYYLNEHLDLRFAEENFPHLYAEFKSYFHELSMILRTRPRQFPHFFPLGSMIRWYLGMLGSYYAKGSTRMVLRNLALIIFWNIRYRVKNKIPFEIPQYYEAFQSSSAA